MSKNGDRSTPLLCAGSEIGCITEYFQSLSLALRSVSHETVNAIANALLSAYHEERAVFLIGNGGSASLASHFACDLGKGTTARIQHGRRFRAHSLTDNIAMMTAWANDANYADIFAEQLRNFVKPRDVVLAISGSGNSPNVLNGLEVARERGAFCIGLTGFRGGKMKPLCDLCLVVPSDNMQVIEDIHLSVAHALFTTIRRVLEAGL